MHIVQILPELNQGGVERGTVELSRELVKRGHQSTVISSRGKLAEQIEKEGGRHITLDVCSKNPLTIPQRVSALRALLSDLRPSVIHARSRLPAWLCWFANKKLNLPFVTTVHGFNHVSKYSKIMTKGDAVICVSHPVKEYIQQNYHTPDEKITVIHRGIDPAEFDPNNLDNAWIDEFREKYGLAGKFVVTSVGRITELKDYETFIRSVAETSKTLPEIRGLIIGGVRHNKQALYKRLQALVHELDVKKQIVFAGSQSKLPEIYTLSDLLVSCSKKPESFGRTLIEAMAINTPVIATRHGGALDIICKGINGFFFPPSDPNALAKKISQSLEYSFSNLRTHIEENFSLDRMIEAELAIYHEQSDSS